jgi:hypothetical protein
LLCSYSHQTASNFALLSSSSVHLFYYYASLELIEREQLSEEFGKEAPLTITRGKVHEYLGMQLDFTTPGKV